MQDFKWDEKYGIFQENEAVSLELRQVYYFMDLLNHLERERIKEEQKKAKPELEGKIDEIPRLFGHPYRNKKSKREQSKKRKVYRERGE